MQRRTVLANASGKQISVQTTPLSGSAQSWSDDDLRSTARYRARVARNLLGEFLSGLNGGDAQQ